MATKTERLAYKPAPKPEAALRFIISENVKVEVEHMRRRYNAMETILGKLYPVLRDDWTETLEEAMAKMVEHMNSLDEYADEASDDGEIEASLVVNDEKDAVIEYAEQYLDDQDRGRDTHFNRSMLRQCIEILNKRW